MSVVVGVEAGGVPRLRSEPFCTWHFLLFRAAIERSFNVVRCVTLRVLFNNPPPPPISYSALCRAPGIVSLLSQSHLVFYFILFSISEKTVHLVGGALFLVFGLHALVFGE